MKVSFGTYWQEYGQQTIEVPDGLNNKEIVEYLQEIWDDVPLPKSGSYVYGSDELDEESIVIENV